MPEALPPLAGLYGITPETPDGGGLLRLAEAALAGGCRWLQYRDKTSPPAERRARAQALLAACRRRGAALVINDDLALAVAVGADGVHLGRDDGDIAAARQALGPGTGVQSLRAGEGSGEPPARPDGYFSGNSGSGMSKNSIFTLFCP